MALQIRRGPTADRMAFTPVVGELIFDTSTNSLYIGNGSTVGGLPAGTLNMEDVQDIAGAMLVGGTHNNVTFAYNDTTGTVNSQIDLTTYDGTIAATAFTGSVFATDSTLLLNAATGAVNLNGTVKGNVVPNANEVYDLGSASNRFRDLYLSGSSIKLGAATITATGTAVNLPAGSLVNGVAIAGGSGVEAGMNYNINIIGDDSTVIINASTRSITAAGGFIGNLTGNTAGTHTGAVVGSVTGNIITNLISSADSSSILFDTPTRFQTSVDLDDNLFINGGTLEVRTNEIDDNVVFAVHASSDQPGVMLFRRSRGTRTAPQAVAINDRLQAILFNAFDGTSYVQAAAIQAQVLAAPSAGVVPTGLRFFTTNVSGLVVEAFRINEFATTEFLTAATMHSPDGLNNFNTLSLHNYHTSATDASNVQLRRARGVRDSEVIVQTGDPIYDINFQAWDGTQYTTAGSIRGVVANTTSVGVVPGRVDIRAANNTGTNGNRVQIDAYKTVFNNMPVLPTFVNEAAATAAVNTTLTNGMMYYDTALSKIRAVAGGVWIDLH